MRLLDKVLRSGIGQKALREAQKPANQAKARDAITKITNRRKGGNTRTH